MEDFNKMSLSALVDMLAKHTNEYMKMLKDGTTEEEYARCKNMIKNLTAEIEYRKQKNQSAKKSGDTKAGSTKL